MMKVRTPWQVTQSVWYALFMREALSRLFANRFAWFWLFAEPLLFVIVMVSIRTFIQVMDSVAGAPMVPWMIIGLVAFFMFRDGMTRAMGAIGANKGLFAYRQIKPVDTVLVRVFVEGFVRTLVLFLLLIGMGLLGYEVIPVNVVGVMLAWGSVWLLGLSVGLLFSVVGTIIPELSKLVNIITLPLLIISGAVLPLQYMPYSAQEILIYNPIFHSLELVRLSFFKGYWTLAGVSYLYLYAWIFGFLSLGLMMHLRFEKKLKAM